MKLMERIINYWFGLDWRDLIEIIHGRTSWFWTDAPPDHNGWYLTRRRIDDIPDLTEVHFLGAGTKLFEHEERSSLSFPMPKEFKSQRKVKPAWRLR